MKKGFTLIETLVAIVVFTISLGAVSGLIVTSYRHYENVWQQALATNEARTGVEVMIKQIREARPGDDGSYPIVLAGDKEFSFFSDIDEDGETEKVRYFLGSVGSGSDSQECVTFSDGGSCSVTFSDFLDGELSSAEIVISVEGDFGWSTEYADIYIDSQYLGRVCNSGCSDCAGAWQGVTTFDITDHASDNTIEILADASSSVNDFCDWQENNHAMKAKFELNWTEDLGDNEGELRKGITNPTGFPPQYLSENEEISILSHYIRNAPPIFRYLNSSGQEITEYPARLKDTKVMKVFLIVDVDPTTDPRAFELESSVQLRNLK